MAAACILMNWRILVDVCETAKNSLASGRLAMTLMRISAGREVRRSGAEDFDMEI